MALTGINPSPSDQKGPSPLENAAKVIGILGTVASVGNQAFGPQNAVQSAQTDYYKAATNNIKNGLPAKPPSFGFLDNTTGIK